MHFETSVLILLITISNLYFSLLLTKSKLEEILYGPDQALSTCRHMLALWKDLYETDTEE